MKIIIQENLSQQKSRMEMFNVQCQVTENAWNVEIHTYFGINRTTCALRGRAVSDVSGPGACAKECGFDPRPVRRKLFGPVSVSGPFGVMCHVRCLMLGVKVFSLYDLWSKTVSLSFFLGPFTFEHSTSR